MERRRQLIRLRNYDYSQSGWYLPAQSGFVTVCTQNREELDTCQIMPDHIHTIIHIVGTYPVGADPCVRPLSNVYVRPLLNVSGSTHGSTPTIGTMIQWFKTMSTNEYIKNVHDEKWKPFNKKLWQRNYYEHIIRTENDLNKIREYIKANPSKVGSRSDLDRILSKPLTCKIIHSIIITIMKFRPKHARPKR